MQRVFIGTAGWAIPRESAHAFTSGGSGLERYGRVMNAAEINTTFYRRHRASTFEHWQASVPPSFRFAVKLPRSITHDADLASPKVALREFFDDVKGLGERLGPLLVQLPASGVLHARRVSALFATLRSYYDGPVACEPRHASWYTKAASAILVRYEVARVAADPPRPLAAQRPGGAPSLVYHRLHGSPRCYWSSYDDARLAALAAAIREAPSTTTTWCLFDNTASGAALANALDLAARVRQPARDATVERVPLR